MIGAISGGCLENDVREAAQQVIAGGAPQLLHYNTGSSEDLIFGTGSGCGGLIQVLLAPVPDDLLAQVVTSLDAGRPAVLETVIAAGALLGMRRLGGFAAGQQGYWYCEQGQVFCQVIEPPATLLVCGAGDDARPLVRYATDAGFRVTVVDHRPYWLTAERFPSANLHDHGPLPACRYAVLLTHHYERDLTHLTTLLDGPATYVGLLGSRERSAHLIRELLTNRPDLSARVNQALHAPVGLDIGADGPHEIALSIVAGLVAHRAGRPGGTLAKVTW